jgi:hypothetical protein
MTLTDFQVQNAFARIRSRVGHVPDFSPARADSFVMTAFPALRKKKAATESERAKTFEALALATDALPAEVDAFVDAHVIAARADNELGVEIAATVEEARDELQAESEQSEHEHAMRADDLLDQLEEALTGVSLERKRRAMLRDDNPAGRFQPAPAAIEPMAGRALAKVRNELRDAFAPPTFSVTQNGFAKLAAGESVEDVYGRLVPAGTPLSYVRVTATPTGRFGTRD